MLVVAGQKQHGKNSQIKTAKHVCGPTKKHRWRKETWWWTADVDSAIKEKCRCYKSWKKGGSKEEYQKAKRLTKHAVYLAKSQAKQEVLKDHSPGRTELFHLAKQMRRENLDVLDVRNLSPMMRVSCAWMTGPWKLPGKNTMSASRT